MSSVATAKPHVIDRFNRLVQDIKDNDPFEFIDHLNGFHHYDYKDETTGNSLLHECINYCNYPALIELLSKGANFNIQNNQSLTPLHIAIWKGYLHLAAPLLKAGADVDAHDAEGRVPLYFAVERGDVRSMRLLLDFHADPNKIIRQKSLLAIASRRGYSAAIKLLLDSGAIFNRGQSHPLIEVLVSGNRESFAVLVHDREHELPYLIINDVPFIVHAIRAKTMLLPVIAAIVKAGTEAARANGDNEVPPFPPAGLTSSEKKRLNKALEVQDSLIPVDTVNDKVKKLKSPWSARGIDEFECLEASYAGGDTVVGEIIDGGDMQNFHPDSQYSAADSAPGQYDYASTHRDYFGGEDDDEESYGEAIVGPPQ